MEPHKSARPTYSKYFYNSRKELTKMTEQNFTKSLILCAFFAALTGVLSIVSIPLPFSPVPVNLALLSVYMAGGLLGPKNGALSLLVYVMLGAIGLPLFLLSEKNPFGTDVKRAHPRHAHRFDRLLQPGNLMVYVHIRSQPAVGPASLRDSVYPRRHI
jgi:hypothetical protein